MAGSFGEMGNLLKQAQEMQRQLERAREQLAATVVHGSAGGGAVRVEFSGDKRLLKVAISDEVVASADRSLLEDLVVTAVRDGLGRAHRLSDDTLSKLTGGLPLPGGL